MSEPGRSSQPVFLASLGANGDLAAAIVGTISQPLLVLDDGLIIEAANPRFSNSSR